MASIGLGLSPSSKTGARSMYTDRVSLTHITSNPSLGDEKVLLCRLKYAMIVVF